MKGYLYTRAQKENGETIEYEMFQQVAEKLNIEFDRIAFMECLLNEDGLFCNGRPVEPADFIIYRFDDGQIGKELISMCKICVNDRKAVNLWKNKSFQLRTLNISGIRKPKYIISAKNVKYENLSSVLGEKIVIKRPESSGGKDVSLVKNAEEFKHALGHYQTNEELIFQEYIKNSFGRDLRIYCFKDEKILAYTRKNEKDFRSNVMQGGTMNETEVLPIYESIAKQVYAQTNLLFFTVDLLYDDDSFVFCEINTSPGFEHEEVAETLFNLIELELTNNIRR